MHKTDTTGIKPAPGRALVRLGKTPSTYGSLYIPRSARDADIFQDRVPVAKVLAVGSDCPFTVGDLLLLPQYGGYQVGDKEERLLIIDASLPIARAIKEDNNER